MTLSLGVVMVAPVRLQRVALVVASIVATAFGTAVLSSGWHRPSDAIGAYYVLGRTSRPSRRTESTVEPLAWLRPSGT